MNKSHSKFTLHIFTLVTLLALTFSAVGVTPVYAASMIVAWRADNTLANLDADGFCDLREAIANANFNNGTYTDCPMGAGTDTITFATNFTLTLVAELYVVDNLIINGKGVSNTFIQAKTTPNTSTYRVFEVNGSSLTLNNLTVRNGRCNGTCGGNMGGGGVNAYGGGSSLTITNSAISNNSTDGWGGGISGGTITITNSTISGNSAAGGGGGVSGGDMTVSGSTFSGNTAKEGGGINSTGGSLAVTNSTFSSNSATGASFIGGGGGIYFNGTALTVTNSTLSGNSATGSNSYGGGIYSVNGTVAITNSTFSGNSAATDGGGFANLSTATVTNSTFSGNSAVLGGGIYNTVGSTTLRNTIVANSTSGGNCNSQITADSYNLDTDGTCNSATQKTSGQINLGSLASNGGATQTFALLSGSAAINAGDDSVCNAAPVSNLDQRGTARPLGIHCDVGAYEKVVTSTKAITAFSFTTPAATGSIVGTNITVSVPAGTTVTSLVATFTTTGTSVTVSAASQVSGTTANDFTNPVTYTVTAEDGTTQNYIVTVKIAPGISSIVPNAGTYLGGTSVVITGTNLTGGTVTFGGTAATCTVASATQITCASPAHAFGAADVVITTSNGTVTSTDGFMYNVTETVSDGETQLFGSSGVTIQDAAGGNNPGLVTITRYNTTPAGVTSTPGQLSFYIDIDAAVNSGLNVNLTLCYALADIPAGVVEANLVLYRYANGAWTNMGFDSHDLVNHCVTKNNITDFSVWTLVDPAFTSKDITAFSFTSPAATGVITGTDIAVTVPFATDVTALAATFTTTGASVAVSATPQVSGTTANNFTSPVTYTVTAADTTTKAYIVTVTSALNPAKDITAFDFASPAVTGVISGTAITLMVPHGTNLTALVPTITHTGASISPNSGVAQDFTNPVIYTVTAADTSTQAYTVTVTVAPSPAKDITAFSFTSPAATGTISGTAIAVSVPHGTNVTALVPTITHSGASVSPNSGVAQDFTNPVIYTVTAEDASTQAYTVTVETWTNKTTANGLGDNQVMGVYANGLKVYAATYGGLSISTDGGATFTTKTPADGLGSYWVNDVFASGSNVYAATSQGLSISTDGGATFTNKTTADGLGNNGVEDVFASGSNVYAATNGGLAISTNGGSTFANKTTADGLGSNNTRGVFVSGSNVYVATLGGLSISTNGGSTFTNKTTADGLGNNGVLGVFVSDSYVYAATGGGLSILTPGFETFTNKTTADGLGSNTVRNVFTHWNDVYAATWNGLSISTDGGANFSNNTIGDGLGSNTVNDVYVSGSTVYAATDGGLSFALFPSTKNVTNDGDPVTFGLTGVSIEDRSGDNPPGLVTVTRYNAPPAGVPSVPNQLSFWIDISAAVNSGLNVSLTLCYSLADIPAGVTEANLVLYRYANGAWTSMGFDSHDLINHCVTKNNISAFSVWTLGDPPPDTTAPTVNTFTATSPSTSLNIPITAFTASDGAGVTGYLISESSTPPSAGAAGWSGAAPTTYPVGSDGSYTLYPWAKDAAGNVSAVFGAPRTVTVDTAAPTVNTFTATSPSASLNIPITAFTASDGAGVTGYLITESSTPPSTGAAGWSGTAPTTYTVGSNGSYTLYPWAKDAAGNVSAVFGAPPTVTVDTTVPTVDIFTATSPSASLNIPITAFTASDGVGVTGYLITESSTPPSAGAAGWSGTAPTTYTVGSNGSYILYPWAKDAAGNVSAVFGSPRTVTVDTTVTTVYKLFFPFFPVSQSSP